MKLEINATYAPGGRLTLGIKEAAELVVQLCETIKQVNDKKVSHFTSRDCELGRDDYGKLEILVEGSAPVETGPIEIK